MLNEFYQKPVELETYTDRIFVGLIYRIIVNHLLQIFFTLIGLSPIVVSSRGKIHSIAPEKCGRMNSTGCNMWQIGDLAELLASK